MMKILCLLLLVTSFAQAKSVSQRLLDKKYYFSALNVFLKENAGKTFSSDLSDEMEEILAATGPEVLEDYQSKSLEGFQTPSLSFINSHKAVKAGDFDSALTLADKIPSSHWLYPESLMLKAKAYGAKKDYRNELESNLACAKAASSRITQKDEHYYRTLSEVCFADHARRFFHLGKFKNAVDEFNRFPKNTYKWPYLLLERAWLYYHLGDYNRSLGLLITYKAPLLDTYFFPEAEYLMALDYYRLCLWQDSSLIINQYYANYKPRFSSLEKILRENKNTPNYFFKMMFRREEELKKYEDFIRHLIVRMKKQHRYSAGFHQIKLLNSEINRVKKSEKPEVQSILLPHLMAVRSNIVTKLDNWVKLELFSMLETVKYFSNELFKMNLEIMARKKDLIYENKQLVSNRSRGDYSNVKRSKFEYFWTFDGAFWADELGDYSLGLKSNCETVNRGAKK
jgi:hypothetical protein